MFQVFPDKPEKRRSTQLFKAALDSVTSLDSDYTSLVSRYFLFYNRLSSQIDGITVGCLDDVPSGPVTSFFKSVRNTLDFDFEDDNEGSIQFSVSV